MEKTNKGRKRKPLAKRKGRKAVYIRIDVDTLLTKITCVFKLMAETYL